MKHPRCPHCNGKINPTRIQRWMQRLGIAAAAVARVGRDHPDTSRVAAAAVTRSGRGKSRAKQVVRYLRDNGPATDDQVDAYFAWGHQCTSALMSNLRSRGVIVFTERKRLTRKGFKARVNALVED